MALRSVADQIRGRASVSDQCMCVSAFPHPGSAEFQLATSVQERLGPVLLQQWGRWEANEIW